MYLELLRILEKYGPVEMSTQIRTIKEILIYLDTANESENVMIKQVLKRIKACLLESQGWQNFISGIMILKSVLE